MSKEGSFTALGRVAVALALGVLALGVAASAACTPANSGTAAEPAASPSAKPTDAGTTVSLEPRLLTDGTLRTAPVRLERPSARLTLPGIAEAYARSAAEVSTPVAARILSITHHEGDTVKAGDVLATLSASAVPRLSAEVATARAQRDHAARVLAQEQSLLARQATTVREVSAAERDLRSAEAELSAASSELTLTGVRGGSLTLVAPISGVIVHQSGVVGTAVDAKSILYRIVDPTSLHVRVDATPRESRQIKVGQKATVVIGSETRCRGEVFRKAPTVELERRTVPAHVHLEQPCPELLDGASVDVVLELESKGTDSPLPVVPREAIVLIGGVPYAFVVTARAGEFRAVQVTQVQQRAGEVFLRGGVTAADRVVVAGTVLLEGELLRSQLE